MFLATITTKLFEFKVAKLYKRLLAQTNHTRIVVTHALKRMRSGKPGHGTEPVNIKNYCLGNSSVTHEIAKKDNHSCIDDWLIYFIVAPLGDI